MPSRFIFLTGIFAKALIFSKVSFGGHGQGKIQGPDTGARGGEVDEDQLEEVVIMILVNIIV